MCDIFGCSAERASTLNCIPLMERVLGYKVEGFYQCTPHTRLPFNAAVCHKLCSRGRLTSHHLPQQQRHQCQNSGRPCSTPIPSDHALASGLSRMPGLT
ncbi:hypothetical protein BsWGS_01162 [Bradybaena similaris]